MAMIAMYDSICTSVPLFQWFRLDFLARLIRYVRVRASVCICVCVCVCMWCDALWGCILCIDDAIYVRAYTLALRVCVMCMWFCLCMWFISSQSCSFIFIRSISFFTHTLWACSVSTLSRFWISNNTESARHSIHSYMHTLHVYSLFLFLFFFIWNTNNCVVKYVAI